MLAVVLCTRTRLLVAGLAAGCAMGFAVGEASAGRLSASSQQFRITWSQITFYAEGGINASVRCPLTLEGSFHSRSFYKVGSNLLGYISRAGFGTSAQCTGGAATILTNTLPWQINYQWFTGVLPNIRSVRILIRSVSLNIEFGLGIQCLYTEFLPERVEGEFTIPFAGGAVSGFQVGTGNRLYKWSGPGLCPPEGGFEGTGTVTALGSAAAITITLI